MDLSDPHHVRVIGALRLAEPGWCRRSRGPRPDLLHSERNQTRRTLRKNHAHGHP
ncbi:hypothetical protein L083_1542 [Actinoplanes sp. N902-109]|nr:hypothetical protein L083_1542 [Actinoplanes sp. N902-109]